MEELFIKQISTKDPEYQQLLHFRNRILREPLGMNLMKEDLSGEKHEYILLVMQGREILGCVMLRPQKGKTIKLRQMAIAEKIQGKGIGKILLADAEGAAREYGFEKIVLHARLTARKFYEKSGYQAFGDIFTEVSIPHIAMHKSLKDVL